MTSISEAKVFQTDIRDTTPPQARTSKPVLTLKMVHQMIVSAFSALGLQGKGYVVSSPLFVDSGTSNHMRGIFLIHCIIFDTILAHNIFNR